MAQPIAGRVAGYRGESLVVTTRICGSRRAEKVPVVPHQCVGTDASALAAWNRIRQLRRPTNRVRCPQGGAESAARGPPHGCALRLSCAKSLCP